MLLIDELPLHEAQQIAKVIEMVAGVVEVRFEVRFEVESEEAP